LARGAEQLQTDAYSSKTKAEAFKTKARPFKAKAGRIKTKAEPLAGGAPLPYPILSGRPAGEEGAADFVFCQIFYNLPPVLQIAGRGVAVLRPRRRKDGGKKRKKEFQSNNNLQMKKISAIAVFLLCCKLFAGAQESGGKGVVMYGFFVNYLPAGFDFPGIGLVNIAKGSHATAYVGLANYAGRLSGAQVGLANVNLSGGKGVAQIGLVNANLSRENRATQIGLVNANRNRETGAQIGLANVNRGKTSGLQLGLFNYADTASGLQAGIVSIVRKGGYRALEAGLSETAPIQAAFKLGVEKLYTSFALAYRPGAARPYLLGLGFGTHIPLGKRLFFNPEISQMHSLGRSPQQQILRFAPGIGLRWGKLHLLAGPSLRYAFMEKGGSLDAPFAAIYTHNFGARRQLAAGLQAGVRFIL
jgi:hypothetical protein